MGDHPKDGWDVQAYLGCDLNMSTLIVKLNSSPSYKTMKNWAYKHIPRSSLHWTEGWCVAFANFEATSRTSYEEFHRFNDYAIACANYDTK
jgi:hypothetical protein